MKLNQMLTNAKRKVVDFTRNPDKMRGLATGIAITVVGALALSEVKDSRHKKELKEETYKANHIGYADGLYTGVTETLVDMVAKEDIDQEQGDKVYQRINGYISEDCENQPIIITRYAENMKANE